MPDSHDSFNQNEISPARYEGSRLLTPAQCRMARAALLWTLRDLSDQAEVSVATIVRFEAAEGGRRRTNPANLAAMRHAFERAGVALSRDPDGSVSVKCLPVETATLKRDGMNEAGELPDGEKYLKMIA